MLSDPVTSSLRASYVFGMLRGVMQEQHVNGFEGQGRKGRFFSQRHICISLHLGEVEMIIYYRSCPSRLYILL